MKNDILCKNDTRLFVDIIKILSKYDEETVCKLVTNLSNPEYVGNIVKILNEGKKANKEINKTRIDSSAIDNDIKRIINNLESFDAEKAVILNQIYEGLIKKEYLATIKDLRNFVQNYTHMNTDTMTRMKAIHSLISELSNSNTNKLIAIYGSIELYSRPQNTRNQLKEWSDIIIK